MKKGSVLFALILSIGLGACNNNAGNNGDATDSTSESTTLNTDMNSSTGTAHEYVDLKTGTAVRRDEATGRYVDDAGNPVDFYVDVNTKDTFYGETGTNVNNALINSNGEWKIDDTKIKIDGDEIKMKSGDTKVKMEDDEYKRKTDDSKLKVDGDEVKTK
jgi:hypothetical protein